MDKCSHKSPQEAASRYYSPESSARRCQYQADVQGRSLRIRHQGQVDLAVFLLVCVLKCDPSIMLTTRLCSLRLLRTFYNEGLINRKIFYVWLVNQTVSCNLAQAGFVFRIADEYFEGMMGCRALTRPFLEGCLSKLLEVKYYCGIVEYQK